MADVRRYGLALRSRLIHSPVGVRLAEGLVRALGSEVFSRRSYAQAKFDLLRLRARLNSRRREPVQTSDKLHLGCGHRRFEGWQNVDVAGSDFDVDLASGRLPWKDRSFRTVVSQQVIEHLELHGELLPLLSEIRRIVVPGGEVWLSCPDLDKVCGSYVGTAGRDLVEDRARRGAYPVIRDGIPSQWVINWMFHQGGSHMNLYDFELLCWAASRAGFSSCTRTSEGDLRAAFPEIPERGDDYHGLYVRLVS